MLKKILFFIGLSLLLVFPVLAYQSPGRPTGLVNDFANVLSPATRAQLEAKLQDYAKKESNEISVVTVKSLEGDTIENFAVKLFAEWKIGKAKTDNGVLLLIAPNEHEVRIEVGYGLEGVITDLQSNLIIQNVLIPAFKSGDYDGGLNKAVDDIMAAAKGEYTPAASGNQTSTGSVIFAGLILIFIVESSVYSLRRAANSKTIWPGAISGGIVGVVMGLIASVGLGIIGFLLGGAVLGILIDLLLSHSKTNNGPRGGVGGFFLGGGGGSSGGGFGGFGGGSSGGGGASGKW